MRRLTMTRNLALASALTVSFLTGNLIQADQPAPVTKASSSEFRAVVKKTLPAVVSILSIQGPAEGKGLNVERLRELMLQFGEDAGLRKYREEFDLSQEELLRQLADAERSRQQPLERTQGFGSGVIVSEDGVILTNNHVVEGATTAQIRLQDDRLLESSDIFRDPKTDLAIIKLKPEDAKNLPVAKLGDSDAAEIGDWVLAMGAPFGLTGSVTAGIISAKGRAPRELGLMYMDFLQTDAQINPGNSGGPIVNLDGEIVGINTAIRSSTGEFSGVAFSIPSNMAKPVMADLAKFGRVRRGYLGIHMDQLQADQLQKLGLKNGVVIQGMTPGETPARKAGLLESDVIVEVDGKPVTTTRQLQDMVVQSNGKTLNVKVRRTGKGEISIPVTIDEQPDDFGPQLVASRIREREPEREEIKVEVSPVESLGIEVAQHDEGLLIASVTKDSLADQFGLQPGTVILSAEGKPVRSAPELVAAIDAADPAKGAMLRVQDQEGNVRFEVIRKVEP